MANLDPKGMVGTIHVGDHLTLLYILNIIAIGPNGCREGFWRLFHYKSMRGNDLKAWSSMVGRINVDDDLMLRYTIYQSFGPYDFREVYLLRFSIISLRELMSPRAWPNWSREEWFAGFMKVITLSYYSLNIWAMDLIVPEQKTF